MPNNQYLPFATAGGANVLAPADYSGLAARLAGFTAGTALSVQLNTVWRQSSVTAAMLGQFVGDIGGFDALDDGSVANLLLSFEKTIQGGKLNYTLAGGTANALTATLTPAPASLAAIVGAVFNIKISASANTGAATINVNGLGATPLVRSDSTALKPGDLAANSITSIAYDGTNFQVVGVSGATTPLSGSTAYATPGTYSWTVPAGVYRVLAECWGAGGGGGGAGMNSSPSAASAGGGGGYARKWISVTPGQVLSIIVGAGGTAGSSAGGNGGNAGSTSVGGVVTSTGGSAGTGVVDSIVPGAAGTGGTSTSGDVNISGYPGGTPVSSGPLGGIGGTSFSSSAPPPNQNAAGNAGVFPGGGGNGGSRSTAGNSAGGVGASGFVILSY